ncbi:MAG: RsmE family RNA methyltransferase, partial [Cyanobacteria bacterium P01_F01_bin.42]
LGVRHIYPLLSERTQVRPSEQRLRRWQTIAREATEQSWRQFVPQVHPPVRFEAWLASLEMTHPVCFCSTRPGQASLLQTLGAVSKLPQVTIVTGPEGGWSSEEEAQLVDQKCIGVGLGPRTLRAVTAPVCALSLIAAFLEPSSPEA